MAVAEGSARRSASCCCNCSLSCLNSATLSCRPRVVSRSVVWRWINSSRSSVSARTCSWRAIFCSHRYRVRPIKSCICGLRPNSSPSWRPVWRARVWAREPFLYVGPHLAQDGQRVPHSPLRSPTCTLPHRSFHLFPRVGLHRGDSTLPFPSSGPYRVASGRLLRFWTAGFPGILFLRKGLSSGELQFLTVEE